METCFFAELHYVQLQLICQTRTIKCLPIMSVCSAGPCLQTGAEQTDTYCSRCCASCPQPSPPVKSSSLSLLLAFAVVAVDRAVSQAATSDIDY